jgi:SOS-response transcriptional repressor LexA
MRAPTEAQLRMANLIWNFTQKHGYPPTLRELCDRTGFSIKGVGDHVEALRRKGVLAAREHGRARDMVFTRDGAAACGFSAPPPLGTASAVKRGITGTVDFGFHCARCGVLTFAPGKPCVGCREERAA